MGNEFGAKLGDLTRLMREDPQQLIQTYEALQAKGDVTSAPAETPGQQFLQWLADGIRSQRHTVNAPSSFIYTVQEGLLIMPRAFQAYSPGNWEAAQKSFLELELHKKTPDGCDIWRYNVQMAGGTTGVRNGFLIENPQAVLGLPSLLPPNPYGALQADSEPGKDDAAAPVAPAVGPVPAAPAPAAPKAAAAETKAEPVASVVPSAAKVVAVPAAAPADESRHTITVRTTEAQLLYAGRALDPANIDPRTNEPRPKIEGIGEFISRLAKMYKSDNTAALAQADAAMADAEATLQKIAGEMTGMEADSLKTTVDTSQRARKLDIGYTFPAARRLAALLVAYDDVVLQIIAANRFARLKNKERDGQLAAARKPFNRIFAVTGKMPL